MTDPLATAVATVNPPDSGIRVGVVTAVESTTRLTCNIGGGVITGLPYLESYLPAVGDNVQIVRMDATWLVVGVVGPFPGQVIAGCRGTSTTAITGIAGTETDIPFLSFTASVKNNWVYEIFTSILVTQTVATDAFTIQVRRDTAVTGSQMGFGRYSTEFTAAGGRWSLHAPFECSQDETITFFFSAVRATGTGTLSVIPRLSGGDGQLSSYSKIGPISLGTSIPGSGWQNT